MDERMRRVWLAAEAKAIGWGGLSAVAKATGASITTIRAGLKELGSPEGMQASQARIRRSGGGRRALIRHDGTLLQDLESLVEPTSRGDPDSPLRWTCKSPRHLADALADQGHRVSYQTVATLLQQRGYSLQANRKTQAGGQHPDRNAQFEHIADQVQRFQSRGQPIISVDTKKKELIGPFRNPGREWSPKRCPESVKVYDFIDKKQGKAIPYGVYDLTHNEGWVSVGIDHDTAEFAVESIRRWWWHMGSRVYPRATELLITADGGGSNGRRVRLWKVALQRLADTLGLRISVCHFPPGTRKWNKIEHRMFCHITENWRARPLSSLAVVINLIAHTKTRTGLHLQSDVDTSSYKTGIKVSDQEFATLQLEKDTFHGEWNYTILPKEKI
jgi:transposase